jgi:hypothetical protein
MAAENAVKEAREATVAARQAVEVTRDIGARELRAYVNETDIKVRNFAPDKLAVFRVNIKNAGNTPAYNVRVCVVVYDSDTPAGAVRFRHLKPTSTAIISGESAVESETDLLIPAQLHGAVAAGNATVIIAGYIRYRDIFRVKRGSTFKAYLRFANIKNGAGAMTAAARNNYAN